MYDSQCLIHGHPPGPLLGQPIPLVLHVHVAFREVAASEVKVGSVQGYQLGKQHVLNLENIIRGTISINQLVTNLAVFNVLGETSHFSFSGGTSSILRTLPKGGTNKKTPCISKGCRSHIDVSCLTCVG